MRHQNLSNPGRPAFTLVEMIVVTSLSAFITGMTVAAIAAMFHHDRGVTQHVAERNQLGQLADRLRRDLHQARSFKWDSNKQSLTIQQQEGQSVEYCVLGSRWVRRESGAEAEPIITRFALSNSFLCECESKFGRLGDTVQIAFGNAPTDAASNQPRSLPLLECRIVSILGRDSLLLHQ